MRMTVYAAVLTAMLGMAAYAQDSGPIVDQAPPSDPVYEVKPGNRAGHYLAPGYWRWEGTRHIWTPSRWVPDRPGYSWVPDGWEQRGNKWHFVKGYWADPVTGEEAPEETTASSKPSANAKADTAKSKKKTAKRPRKPDYNNTRVWPTIGRH